MFVSHMSYPDTRLCHESSLFGHKGPANISLQEIEKRPGLGFDQPKTGVQQLCVIHTPFQFVDRDSPPVYEGKDHSQPIHKYHVFFIKF